MPELPEVEVTRRGFADVIRSARVLRLRLSDKPLRWPLGVPPARLAGQMVHRVDRRGKYLLLHLDDGILLIHLGMSGSLRFARELPQPGAHDHADLVTTHGVLRLHDPRRFGAVVWSPGLDVDPARKLLGSLGVEPLSPDFQPLPFHAALHARRAAIKQVLLAGDVVVGVGNIYACEALFEAGIRPTVRAHRLSRPRVQRLHAAIQRVLQCAIDSGGSTLRDYTGVQGQAGHFQLTVSVYGRAGEPCHVCGTAIKHIRQGQRSSYYCPSCQRF